MESYDTDKNGYEHIMLKEIHEQPTVIKNTIEPYFEKEFESLINKMPDFSKYNKVVIVACGSAMHAGLIGKNMIEEFADIPVEVEIASEFRYKKVFIDNNSLVIGVSQSGETADTLKAIEKAKEKGADTLGIISRKGSTIARNVDYVLYTNSGIEKAVATTKAYSAQVALLSLIAFFIKSFTFCHSFTASGNMHIFLTFFFNKRKKVVLPAPMFPSTANTFLNILFIL